MYYNKSLRTLIIIFFVITMFFLCFLRLVNLQIINGKSLRKVSEDKLFLSMRISAPRGNIYDRYGNILATNRTGYSIKIEKDNLKQEQINDVIYQLLKIVGNDVQTAEKFPVSKKEPFTFAFEGKTEKENKQLHEKWCEENNISKALNASQVIAEYSKKYKIDDRYTKEQKRAVIGIVYDMKLKGFSLYNPYVFANDISAEVVAKVKENSTKLKSVYVYDSPVRTYPNGTVASHILGNVGVIYKEEYDKLKDRDYSMNAFIGKQGVELSFEDYLKGKDGIQGFEQTANGLSDVVTSTPAEYGNNVFLTIDLQMQKTMEDTMRDTISNLSKSVSDCNAGSAVCLDVNTGEILAMASYPTYKPDEYNTKYNELIKNPANPVWNRAIGGAYEPGSTFKMLTAIASLEEGVIEPQDTILDEGVYKYYKDYQPQCMEWKYGKTHGYVDVIKALQESCNYYFFEVGRRLGIEKLDEYAEKFGFGKLVNIEIKGEVAGQIASPKNKEKRGEKWNPGDTLQASIGQSDNLITPLQLANYVATIANGGTKYQPHLLKTIKDYDTGTEIKKSDTKVIDKIDIAPENLSAVKKGMEKVTQEGTASSVFKDFFINIAGKTGTAEVSRGSNNGIFVAYAPAENPQIAVAIVIEHGTGGYLAAPIAKAVFEEYFKNKDIVDYRIVNTLNK